jgi:hypothetical protein
MVEHPLVAPHITRMEGSLDSVMGLAKQLLLRLLCRAAADVLASGDAAGQPPVTADGRAQS